MLKKIAETFTTMIMYWPHTLKLQKEKYWLIQTGAFKNNRLYWRLFCYAVEAGARFCYTLWCTFCVNLLCIYYVVMFVPSFLCDTLMPCLFFLSLFAITSSRRRHHHVTGRRTYAIFGVPRHSHHVSHISANQRQASRLSVHIWYIHRRGL